MQITDVRIRKISSDGKMKAIVSVTFDNEFVVHDIKVIDGQNGLFIAMPSRKTPEGDFKDIAHPINTDTREKIQNSILEEYEKVKLATDVEEVVAVESTEEVEEEKEIEEIVE
ncbi:MAG: septation regulator SpoVG [Clostridium sp.]